MTQMLFIRASSTSYHTHSLPPHHHWPAPTPMITISTPPDHYHLPSHVYHLSRSPIQPSSLLHHLPPTLPTTTTFPPSPFSSHHLPSPPWSPTITYLLPHPITTTSPLSSISTRAPPSIHHLPNPPRTTTICSTNNTTPPTQKKNPHHPLHHSLHLEFSGELQPQPESGQGQASISFFSFNLRIGLGWWGMAEEVWGADVEEEGMAISVFCYVYGGQPWCVR